jgi:hypothetical protein
VASRLGLTPSVVALRATNRRCAPPSGPLARAVQGGTMAPRLSRFRFANSVESLKSSLARFTQTRTNPIAKIIPSRRAALFSLPGLTPGYYKNHATTPVAMKPIFVS